MKATLLFRTNKMTFTGTFKEWAIEKTFNDEQHMDNFIAYIERKKDMTIDEVYIANIECNACGEMNYTLPIPLKGNPCCACHTELNV